MLTLSVSGGYNGGAVITVVADNTTVFTSTAPDTYNLNYDVTTGSFSYKSANVDILVTPPANSTSTLGITFSGGVSKHYDIFYKGQNTSYGYDFYANVDRESTATTYDKKVICYLYDSQTQTSQNLGETRLTIPHLDVSQSQFISGWNNASDNTIGLLQYIYSLNGDIRVPYVIPGALETNFDDIIGINYITDTIIGTRIDNISLASNMIEFLGNSNGDGIYIDGTGIFKGNINNMSSKTLVGNLYGNFGIWPTATTAHTVDGFRIVFLLETSDDKLLAVRINYNRNNSGYTSLSSSVLQWLDSLEDYERPTPEPEEDPYNPGGESGEEGGEGDFDNTSDEIEIPDLPTASTVINTGFITLYDANIYDLNDLASYLWSANGLDLETFKKIFADPISAILGLSIFPCSPEITTQDVNVILGNIDTGVGMRKVTNQYRRYDMGTLNLNEYWGGYLDYSPYTSVEIYLPYIGTRTLNADDVMGKALHLVYNIDFLSGSCCAILEVGGTVLYQFMGQCSCPVPVTGRDMTNLVNGVMSVVGAGVGTLVATGGNAALAGASAIGSLASHVTSSKPKIEKSGAMGGMGGMLGVRKPYLVVTRPRQALPASQNTYTGYPSYMTCMLGDLVGFTVMETVHLQDMSATDEEKAEIDRLLKTGVVL